MRKGQIVSGFMFLVIGCLLLVVSSGGCGQATDTATTTTTLPSTQAVKISGTIAASASDLSQLGAGVTTLAIKGSAADLVARGVPASSVKAAGLVPLAVSGTTVTCGPMDKNGNITGVASAQVSSDGSYSVSVSNYDSSKTYGAVVSKTSTDTQKTLEMKVIYPAPSRESSGEMAIKGSDAAISPQTTLVCQMIIEKVVKVLESASIDSKVIANVKDAIISAVDALISSGTISITTVRDSTQTENTRLEEALDKASSDTTIAAKLDSIEGSNLLGKATDLVSAKAAILELFKMMMGNPQGIPEEIVTAFAQAHLNGVTKTTTQLTEAFNNSLYDQSTQQAATGSFTVSQVATYIQNMIAGVHGSALAPGEVSMEMGVKSLIDTVFPKADWKGKTIAADTSFTVPQILVLIEAGMKLAYQSNLGFNPPVAAYKLGLMAGVENKVKIMHAEVRVVTFMDWASAKGLALNTPAPAQPTAKRALMAFVDVGNLINPDPSAVQGLTCDFTYPTSSETKTVSLVAESHESAGGDKGGAPGGFKNFSLQPWKGSAYAITSFVGGTCTITIKNAAGATVDSKTVELVDIDLTTATLSLTTPKPVWIDQISNISKFSKGSKPTFTWKVSGVVLASAVTVPAGYKLAYAVSLRKGSFQGGGFFVNWGDPNSAIFDSWQNWNFIPEDNPGDTVNWTCPTAINDEAFYEFGVTVLALSKTTNQPVSEGAWVGGVFAVGNPTVPTELQTTYKLPEQTIEQELATSTFILEGKVHSTFVGSLTNPKVGVFSESYSSETGFKNVLVSGLITSTFTAISGTSHKSFTLPSFTGSALTKNKRYNVIYFDDTDNDNSLDTGELFMMGVKGFEYREDGLWAFSPDGSAKLSESQTGFNILPWGQSFQ